MKIILCIDTIHLTRQLVIALLSYHEPKSYALNLYCMTIQSTLNKATFVKEKVSNNEVLNDRIYIDPLFVSFDEPIRTYHVFFLFIFKTRVFKSMSIIALLLAFDKNKDLDEFDALRTL